MVTVEIRPRERGHLRAAIHAAAGDRLADLVVVLPQRRPVGVDRIARSLRAEGEFQSPREEVSLDAVAQRWLTATAVDQGSNPSARISRG